ncbi:AMP-binding protein [Nocardia arthritidis]|uniref:AMP-binding protein n=1 Tax=Nocardia arthritidis TaxID=228602 RepID=UPI001EEC8B28|nr:AMP-binding protein [Nocardia arthritidis]
MVSALADYGVIGGALTASAIRWPERVAVIDELGSLTYAELDRRSTALANAWCDKGLRAGGGVAVLVRNHRGFLDAVCAAGKCGARIALLNNDFAGPQILEVVDREGIELLVHIVVPVMLARILDAEPEPTAQHDLSALRVIFVAGSQLGAAMCTRATAAFGPVLYNLYGSTEVFSATIATPADLRAEPGCVGRPVRGAVVPG